MPRNQIVDLYALHTDCMYLAVFVFVMKLDLFACSILSVFKTAAALFPITIHTLIH